MLETIIKFAIFYLLFIFIFRSPVFVLIAIFASIFYISSKNKQQTQNQTTSNSNTYSYTRNSSSKGNVIDAEYSEREIRD